MWVVVNKKVREVNFQHNLLPVVIRNLLCQLVCTESRANLLHFFFETESCKMQIYYRESLETFKFSLKLSPRCEIINFSTDKKKIRARDILFLFKAKPKTLSCKVEAAKSFLKQTFNFHNIPLSLQ